MMDIEKIRKDFPMLQSDIIYLDNGATTFKPQAVIETMDSYYRQYTANAHRGDYKLALHVDQAYENVRNIVAEFINCDKDEVVFTSGATEGLNMIAQGYCRRHLHKGDVIISTYAEHASNILPYYRLKEEIGVEIVYVPFDKDGRITVDNFRSVMNEKVKFIAINCVSNVLGYINPIKEICAIAHQYGALVAVDGAQSVPHIKTDVKELDCDFLAFSAHKLCGPTGVGVLYGKKKLLEETEPLLLGGGSNARFNSCGEVLLKDVPYKFEAGTQPIGEVIAMGEAICYLMNIGMDNITNYEHQLRDHLIGSLKQLNNLNLYNPNTDTGIVTFNVKGIFAQDVASYLGNKNICLRSGNHCAKILVDFLHTPATLRCSLYFYNTMEEIDKLVKELQDITIEKCIDVIL
ncbi:MAG: cysteine desulfurase [Erysipelotrichia bacterium]|nr:cysteine desulfurase [Erysipelotrichia bacterium]